MNSPPVPVPWKALSLTYVVYPAGDPYGKLLALVSLAPFGVLVAQVTLALVVRDIHVVFFLAGQLLNVALNAVLKTLVQEARPTRPGLADPDLSSGWPSNHCQFMAFFLAYGSLCVVHRLRRFQPAWLCALLLLSSGLLTALVFHSRTYLRYHHAHQCLHGALIGLIASLFWYAMVQRLWEPLARRYLLSRGFCSVFLGAPPPPPPTTTCKPKRR